MEMPRIIFRGLVVPTDKDKEMFSLFLDGYSMADVAAKFGITRERVRQIIKNCFGLTGKYNTKRFNNITMRNYLRKRDQKEASEKHRELVISSLFGCHEEIA